MPTHTKRMLCLARLSALTATLMLPPSQGLAQAHVPRDVHERAAQSLVVPATVLSVGLSLIVMAPLITVGFVAGSLRSESGLGDSPQHNDAALIGGAVATTLVGSALTTYGAIRVGQIRSARRKLVLLPTVGVGLAPHTAQLSLRCRF